ncbi:hypothetical protein CHGG_06311 [Chaetomium globosum CBS 148.51]|uniref:Choline kinase N-terminal domain-containing protein n=1 Tax=Chaetomium globosum (strain ATCC 6205 / CBS 148.51 / DSM 1962 / NBRC 6347 / NRRL 1970) TaxID=306901 RepID=Q2H4V4_CHAGB|nr:uncharacterized protein CHGG_06311 [Chaetomium globosum CBS 148.51]EAQ89692.1 hypothetical protein CHGG_06311 [Chaetomium globosum CBS 148.51]
MSAPSPGNPVQPRRSALKMDGDGERAPPSSAPVKGWYFPFLLVTPPAVCFTPSASAWQNWQEAISHLPKPIRVALETRSLIAQETQPAPAIPIAEPQSSSSPDESQVKKQFSAGVAKRLSGRPPLSTTPSRSSTLSQFSMESGPDSAPVTPAASAEDPQSHQPHSHHRHRLDLGTERLLSQVAEWLEREKTKKKNQGSRRPHLRRRSPPSNVDIPTPAPGRARADSIESDSSEVSLDRLQRILDDNAAALGLNSLSQLVSRFGRRHRRKSSSKTFARTASSDTEWFDGDVVVPGCDAVLDNSKTLAYTGGKAGADDSASISSRKEEKERQNWTAFKNEIIRLAHTLRLKGWKRVPLDSGESISVERLSGALTNAVYVVSPPSDSLLPREPGKKQPGKVLLRIIRAPSGASDRPRERAEAVLRRLARKKIGPRLLGTFQNGRFEQYLNATALTPGSMREPETSRQIAKRMRELHDGVELLSEERDQGPGVWKNWDKWLSQVEKTVLFLDRQILSNSQSLPAAHGFVCGVQWPVFKALVDKYRRHLEAHYGNAKNMRDKLVFAHNDVSSSHLRRRSNHPPNPVPPQTQYGNILRVRPDDQKSPLLQPANEHKQLVVIDFRVRRRQLARPRIREPLLPSGPTITTTPSALRLRHDALPDPGPAAPLPPSSSSCWMRAYPQAAGKEEERKGEEVVSGRVEALLEETRLWRTANSAQWVAWGIVQAKVPGLEGADGESGAGEVEGGVEKGEAANGETESEDDAEEEFDYLSYAQERALFFLGDCVLLGLVKAEELGEEVRSRIKLVEY